MKRSYFKYILSLLLFGSNGIVASFISLSSYEIVLLRTVIGSISLLLMFLLTSGKFTFYKYKKDSLFLVISGVAMGTSWMFLYEAYAQIGVGIASLLYYCGPVIVMALSPILFKEKLTAVKIAGFAAVLCGILLINGGSGGESGTVWGFTCGILSAISYSLMVIFNKKAKNITGLENAVFQLSAGFLTAAVFVGLKQGFAMNITGGDILPIIILGLLNTGFGCYLYFSSIGGLPVQSVAICGYTEPFAAVIFSALFLGETMTSAQLVGGALILGGAVVSECVGIISKKIHNKPQSQK